MSLADNITRVHRPAKYEPATVYIACKPDLWQQGDPMFYSIKDHRQLRAGPDHQPSLNPSAQTHSPPDPPSNSPMDEE